jgi:hypothetical protein
MVCVEARLPLRCLYEFDQEPVSPRTSGLADIHPVRVYLGPRVIYAMAQIKYFNRGGRPIPKNRKIALILFADIGRLPIALH